MAVVDITTVELDDGAQLAQQCLPHRFDAQHANDLDDVVRGGARVVNPAVGAHDRVQVHALAEGKQSCAEVVIGEAKVAGVACVLNNADLCVEQPLVVARRRAGDGVNAIQFGLAHENAPDA